MNIRRPLNLLFAAGLLACAPAFASAAEPAKPADTKPAVASGNSTANPNAASSFQTSNYKLRPTDVIFVNVVDDPKASGEVKIDIDGNILLPYLPEHAVKVVGVSTADAAKLITEAYVKEEIFVKPSITVAVRQAAPRYINFIGQVVRQGKIEIPISKELTLATALGEAGGPTPNADRYVTITRINANGPPTKMEKVDLLAAVKEGKDVPLQEGDIITLGQSILGDVWH